MYIAAKEKSKCKKILVRYIIIVYDVIVFQILERFRKNELSIIVTTNVLEEGIDLQSCNLVIQYDVPKTFASYIQTKGRVRSKSSEYVLMIPNVKKKVHIATIEEFKLVDSVVKEYLIGKTIKREQPDDDDIQDELYDKIIPPYFTPKKAKLTAVSSMGVLYRYVQSLPRDLFTDIGLIWERTDTELLKIVTLHPPIQSKWKEVVVVGFFSYFHLKFILFRDGYFPK